MSPSAGASIVLAADVGGTKTRFGLFRIAGNALEPLRDERVPSAHDVTFAEVMTRFLAGNRAIQPAAACFAVAGPVVGQHVAMIGAHARDPVADRIEALDRGPIEEARSPLGAARREFAAELGAIAALVGRAIDRARDPVLGRAERGIDLGHPVPVDHLHLLTGLGQDAQIRDAALERLRGAI